MSRRWIPCVREAGGGSQAQQPLAPGHRRVLQGSVHSQGFTARRGPSRRSCPNDNCPLLSPLRGRISFKCPKSPYICVHIKRTRKSMHKTKSAGRKHAKGKRKDTCLCIRQPHLAGFDRRPAPPAPRRTAVHVQSSIRTRTAADADVCISVGCETPIRRREGTGLLIPASPWLGLRLEAGDVVKAESRWGEKRIL